MKIFNLLKSMWYALSWYSRRVFNLLLGKTMDIPRKPDGSLDTDVIISATAVLDHNRKESYIVVITKWGNITLPFDPKLDKEIATTQPRIPYIETSIGELFEFMHYTNRANEIKESFAPRNVI